jgi:hypothetical protein
LDQFASFVGPDIAFSNITTDHITRFLAWLQTEYRTSRGQPLSAKTVSGTMPLCPLSGRGPRTKVFYHTLRHLGRPIPQVQARIGCFRWGLSALMKISYPSVGLVSGRARAAGLGLCLLL